MTPHTQRLERWLSPETVLHLSERMNGWYGPPILVGNVPGELWVHGDGNFSGRLLGGEHVSLADRTEYALRRARRAVRRSMRGQLSTAAMGFSSLSDLIFEATSGGKAQYFTFSKTGSTGAVNVANSLWTAAGNPPAGSAASGTTAGHTPDNTTTGGLQQSNAAGGDTLHFVSATMVPTVGANCLLMYDRFYAVNHNIATQSPSVTGVSSRYQDTTSKGAFIGLSVTTTLGGTPGTYQLTYMDQDGNTAEAGSAIALVSARAAPMFPFTFASTGNGWFYPLNSPDTGVRKLTQITQSVATGTGNIDVFLGMPIVWIPQGIASVPVIIDGINSAFNLRQIVSSACLAFLEVNKGATTATSYFGQIVLVSG